MDCWLVGCVEKESCIFCLIVEVGLGRVGSATGVSGLAMFHKGCWSLRMLQDFIRIIKVFAKVIAKVAYRFGGFS